MAKPLPSSKASYLKGIRKVLPPGCLHRDLGKLDLFKFDQAYPEKNESLHSWIDTAWRNREGKLPLTMILGETWSNYRKARQPLQKGRQSSGPLLNMAYTCDGAAGTRALIGLLRNSHLSLDDLDFSAVIDEWTLIYSGVRQRVKNSHLIVLGTPEVNILATILHGLVRDFHYGRDLWPPDLSSTGDKLFVCNAEYVRCPRAHEHNDCGGVFLVRNPWNPNYRILWIGGLSGIGTWHGSLLVASGWREYPDMAGTSTGVVFGRDVLGGDKNIRPRDWLIWNEGEPVWQNSLKPQLEKPPEKGTSKKHVFLSYCRDNDEQVRTLHDDLRTAGEDVWWDKDILPGQKWKLEIRKAIKNSYAVVLCFSKELTARLESGVYPEVDHALSIYRRQTPGSIFLIPVRVSDCEIPDIDIDDRRDIGDLTYVDLFPALKRADGLKRLLQALKSAPGHP
jgi:hypothetical protein